MQLSQSIVRRRKEDTGEPLVERTYCPVRVPFGQRQREPHEKWLKGFERFFCETHPHSPLVEGGVVHPFAAALGQRCRSSSTPPPFLAPTRNSTGPGSPPRTGPRRRSSCSNSAWNASGPATRCWSARA